MKWGEPQIGDHWVSATGVHWHCVETLRWLSSAEVLHRWEVVFAPHTSTWREYDTGHFGSRYVAANWRRSFRANVLRLVRHSDRVKP